MILHKITLHNFRNYLNKEYLFDKQTTLIIGKNSIGKTNLLEAVFFIINGYGFREDKEEELINFTSYQGQVNGVFLKDDDRLDFTIYISKKDKTIKKYLVNKTEKKYFQYHQEQTRTVLFSPEQIDIIIGSPSKRREYINQFISSHDLVYKKALNNYENALRKRNKILERHQSIFKVKDELVFWDKFMEENGEVITKKRQQYITFLNNHHQLNGKKFCIEYIKSEFSRKLTDSNLEKELLIKRTLIGPQKDDFIISIMGQNTKNIHRYGSRSEQRIGLLWLKINELNYYQEVYKITPILLLDDIFSELDKDNQQLIFKLIGNYQTIATSTEDHLINTKNIKLIKL